ncbi:peptidase M1-like protein [Ulvibacter sp. MAR_2010_11]|uniref:M1 family metallopeptidase n=1 Tax=Ulvibacter sp. MAR_2010_11 TaxID=1250229 RepID=UPI000C2BB3D4|nr:M1 family metallopeptidase [Ulvibacter sp. MAR_2010_11]PKA83886.1 peptidase M1-like protein [Ulvibacter sp. MAR_2010_11]
MKHVLVISIFLLSCLTVFSQNFTRQDTLRGSITAERAWWNLIHYDLIVEVQPDNRFIQGSNTITYEVLDKNEVMQIDLQAPMKIDKILQNGKELSFTSEGNAHFINLQQKQKKGETDKLTVYFSGKPKEAIRPPWDGGFTWRKDSNGKHFIATSNQGIGASIWWPNKDHSYDEPDKGIGLAIEVPSSLVAVGNGRLIKTEDKGATKIWHWKVVNPINNYGVNINVGDYVHFGEKYKGLKDELDMDYWVLRENEPKAKKQFLQAPMMMKAFEHWFGPYPFYEDSFKLVEVPYLGMEHQSSITYGNQYKNGYLGSDLSGTGWGLKFDFIIIHEAGHEWFANNITNRDIADMWLHEGFTAYSENLYLDYHFGKEASADYVIGTRRMIQNDRPVIGTYNVQYEGSSDMYYKGANILHTLRQLLEDDEKWRDILVGLNKNFYHQTVSSKQVEESISKETGIDLTEFWEQYLRTTMIPLVKYRVNGKSLQFRYEEVIEKFDMPVIAIVNGKEEWIFPIAEWRTKEFSEPIKTVEIKRDFFVDSEMIKN